jgi:hypothetical protein
MSTLGASKSNTKNGIKTKRDKNGIKGDALMFFDYEKQMMFQRDV